MLEISQDQAIRHLLGELDDGEATRVEAALKIGAKGCELIREFDEAFTAFALGATPVREPSAALRDSILSAVESEGAAEDSAEAATPTVIPFPFVPWLAAACVALAGGMSYLNWRGERADLLQQIGSLEGEVGELVAGARSSDLRIKELASQVDETFKAFIVWDDARGAGVLKVENLPSLGEAGDYQLWVVSDGYKNPLDGGVFDTESGKAEMQIVTKKLAKDLAPADKVTLFAISRERAGGVPISETKDFVLTAAY